MIRRTAFSLTMLLAFACSAAEPNAQPTTTLPRTWAVSAECQMVIVPQKGLLPLIAAFRDEGHAEAAWAQVQKMIETGEATLAGDLTPKGVQGQTLVSGTVEEVRYVTEYEPPKVPEKMPAENTLETLKAWPAVAVTPKTFATRNVGQTLELKASVDADGQWLDAEVTVEDVRLLHWEKFEAGELANGDHLKVEQPFFHSMKDSLNLRLKSGQRTLLGVHKIPDAANSFELFLLQITAAPLGAKK